MAHPISQAGVRRLYLLYHELRREPSNYSYVMNVSRFEQQLQLFVRLHHQPGMSTIPEITFDDGHRSDHELAFPVLERHGLKARFFITAGWTGMGSRYMSWSQIKELHRAAHPIGAHGWSHRLLTQCSPDELREELAAPRKLLEDRLGAPVHSLSLPGGRHNRRVLEACRVAGYTQVYTSHPRLEADPDAPLLGRLNLRGDATLDWLANLLSPESQVLKRMMRQDRIKQASKAVLGDSLYARVWRLVNRAEPETEESTATVEAELL